MDVIDDVSIGISRKQGREPMGTFLCPLCGYTYCRVGPDRTHEMRYKGKVVRYGFLWDEKFKQLWNSGSDRTRIAEEMKVQYDTLLRQSRRLGLTQSDAVNSQPVLLDKQWYRDQWVKILNAHASEKPISELAMTHSDIYLVLERTDLEWLKSHQKGSRSNLGTSRVDWSERDNQLSSKVFPAVKRIVLAVPLRRITANSIGIEIGYKDGGIHKELIKLPKTKALINHTTETHEDFAIRRISAIFDKLDFVPTRSQIFKLAGLSKAVQSTRVINFLDIEICKLSDRLN